jgi:hypothetical protein
LGVVEVTKHVSELINVRLCRPYSPQPLRSPVGLLGGGAALFGTVALF